MSASGGQTGGHRRPARRTGRYRLRAHLSCGLSVRGTAERLEVHENTVSYRLRRVVRLLGVESPDALVRADILLALRAVDLGLHSAP